MSVNRTLTIGHLISGSFGLVFMLVNGGWLPPAGRLLLNIVGVAAFVFVFLAFVVSTRRYGNSRPGEGFTGRYWLIVGAEAVLLFGGLAVIRSVQPAAALGWIALIVGLHFIPMAWLWPTGRAELLAIGITMTVLGVIGLGLAFVTGDGPLVALVSGVGSGVILLGWPAIVAASSLSRRR